MNHFPTTVFIGLAAALSVAAALPARAQQGAAVSPLAPAPTPAPASASRAGTRLAADLLPQIGAAGGVSVVAGSTITERVALPATPTTPQNVEQQIAAVVAALPTGTRWVKIWMPAPPAGRAWNGDDVADYVLTQEALFGRFPEGAAADTVVLQGQRVPAERAKDLITALQLKPVYVVMNPAKTAQAAPGAPGAPAVAGMMDLGRWTQMTPEQQQQYAQQAATQLLSMDPQSRQQFIQQQRTMLGQVARQMTPEQRAELLRSLIGGVVNGNAANGGAANGGGQNIMVPVF